MRIVIDPRKSIHENAAAYYEKAKKLRMKAKKALAAVEETKRMIEKQEAVPVKKLEKRIVRKKEWFEKYRWTLISNHLMIGGKGAKSNEEVVRKHLEKEDLFFHADIHGASAMVLKKGQECSEEELSHAAVFAACFSRAWKEGRGAVDVYCVKPEQVKLAAKSGEFLAKGSFVIEGKRKWFRNVELVLALTWHDERLLICPVEEVKRVSSKFLRLKPDASSSKQHAAKQVLFKLGKMFPEASISIDYVQEVLPTGGSKIY